MRLVILVVIGIAVTIFGLKRCTGSNAPKLPFLGGKAKQEEHAKADQDAVPAKVTPPVFNTSQVITFHNRVVPSAEVIGRGGEGQQAPVTWTVDTASNSILVRGEAKGVADMVAALRQLDIGGDECFVDGTMMFVRGDRVKDFEATIAYREGASLVPSATLSPGGFGVVLPWDAFNVSLSWLSENGYLQIIDKPQVRLASGEMSEVSTGSEVAVPTTTFTDAVSRTSIEFRRVGLTFKVRPLFLDAGRVRLDVEAENGVLGSPQKVGDYEVPTITSQRVKSVATMTFDDGLMIGGLETVRRSQRFGLLGKSETVEAGRLYLLLVLRSGQPKAVPVDPAGFWSDWDSPATLPAVDDLPGSVLPPMNWRNEERSFLRSRGHPAK
ncbi:type II secretion system protein GspD [Luteolibacter soli]|uniref:Type II/III secretion system secretin-like domain-containing protein n=1 Tax=Luteolibacter soli TaxID=3135280 RepID=A0ABU9ATM0_9BACT